MAVEGWQVAAANLFWLGSWQYNGFRASYPGRRLPLQRRTDEIFTKMPQRLIYSLQKTLTVQNFVNILKRANYTGIFFALS